MRLHEMKLYFLSLQKFQSKSLGVVTCGTKSPEFDVDGRESEKNGIDHDHNQTQPQIMVYLMIFDICTNVAGLIRGGSNDERLT